MPIWPPVMAVKNDDNKLYQGNLSCKGAGCIGGHLAGHLGGHIAIFHIYFGGQTGTGKISSLGLYIYMFFCKINKFNNTLQTCMSWLYFSFEGSRLS